MAIIPKNQIEQYIFVGRGSHIQTFIEAVNRIGQKQFSVLVYFGVAGIGKTSLRKEFTKVLIEYNVKYQQHEVIWASIDLQLDKHREKSTFFVTLKNELQKKHKILFPAFEIAHAIYWKKANPEIPLRKENYLLFEGDDTYDDFLYVSQIPYFSLVPTFSRLLKSFPDYIIKWWTKSGEAELTQLINKEPVEIEEMLPYFWAQDLDSYLKHTSKSAVLFIDTYEALWENYRYEGIFRDKWIREELIPRLPRNVLWVICSREKLQWEEIDSKWGEYLTQYQLEELLQNYCMEYLEARGITDKEIQEAIFKGSKGVPYYLELSADTYEKILENDEKPKPEDFGNNHQKITDRFFRSLSPEEKNSLNVLSVPHFWDYDLFKYLVKEFNTGYSINNYEDLCSFSFIRKFEINRHQMHQLMQDCLQRAQVKKRPDSVKRIHKSIHEYYGNKLDNIDIKVITREHETALTESFYHAKKWLEAEDLLNWFINASDSFSRAAFWQLITPMYEEMLQILEAELGPEHLDVATTLNNLATLYRHMGDYDKALPIYQRALDIIEKALGMQHPSVSSTLNNLATLYRHMGDYEKALSLYQKTIKFMEVNFGSDTPEIATTINGIAELYYYMGDYKKSFSLYQRALEIREKTLGSIHPEVAATIYGIAELYRQTGEYEKSFPLFQRALEIREKTLGNKHPEVAATINGIAEFYKNIGDYERSLLLYQRALEIQEKTLGYEHPDVAITLNYISEIYHYLGKKEEALVLMERALTIYERILPANHPSIATSLNNLGLLYQSKKEHDKAKKFYYDAIFMFERTLGPDHPSIAITLNNLASLYSNNNEYKLALPLLKRALGINRKNFGDDNPELALTLSNISALYVEMNETVEANKHYKQALRSYERILEKNPKNSLYQYLYASNLDNFGKFLGTKSFAEAENCYKKSLEIFTEPLNEKTIEAKSTIISNFIQLSFENAKNKKSTSEKEKCFEKVYQLYEKYIAFFSEHDLEEKSKLIKKIGVFAYIQNLVLTAQAEPDIDIRIEKYNICISKVSQIVVEEDDDELKMMWTSIMHYLEGRKLINEATKSVLPDLMLTKRAIEQFRLARDKYETAQACYCIYKIILELSENEVLNNESLMGIKELLEIAENTLKSDIDQNLMAIFAEIKLLIKENTEEVDPNVFFRLNHYIERINYYGLRKHFNYVAQKVMLVVKEEEKKKARFASDSTFTTEFNKPEKETFSPEVSYRNWRIEIKFNDINKIDGKVTIKVEDKTLYFGYLNDNIKYIYYRLCKQEETIEIINHNGDRVSRKISFYNIIECSGKSVPVYLFEQDCSKRNPEINSSEINCLYIGVVQLKYHLRKEGNSLEVEDNPQYRRKVFSILDSLIKKVNIIVFPEFSIPFKYLSDLKKYSDKYGIIIIAGSHYIKRKNLEEYDKLFDVKIGEKDLLKNVCPVIVPYTEKIFHTEKVCGAAIERDFLQEKMENGTLNRIFKFYENITCGVMICFDFLIDELRSSIGKASKIVFVPQSNESPKRFQLVADYEVNTNPKYEHNIAYIMANGVFTYEKTEDLIGGSSGVILTLNKSTYKHSNRAIITPVNKELEQFVLKISLNTNYFASRELQVGQIPLDMDIIHIYDKQDLIRSGKKNVETFLNFFKEVSDCEDSDEVQKLIKNKEKILKECSPLLHKKLAEDLSDLTLERIKNRCQYIVLDEY